MFYFFFMFFLVFIFHSLWFLVFLVFMLVMFLGLLILFMMLLVMVWLGLWLVLLWCFIFIWCFLFVIRVIFLGMWLLVVFMSLFLVGLLLAGLWPLFLFCLLSSRCSNVLNLHGEGYFGVLYSSWSKIISVGVRPLSLMLRLFINLTIGHLFMLLWVYFCLITIMSSQCFIQDVIGLALMQGILSVIVFYEFFVFFLQSFIFGCLLGVYLEEC
uniref:ATP synthase subunit a n=1 Tax=Passalurus ambiguus TaxID=451380 RepID=A0A0P0IQT2_PASAG|nr:ATP synthase F0 subunit 6 [Passalurus ambiguus]ALJ93250.1 ATP synthase F0 subunit 6 [Passalurus ambiguus]